MHSLNKPQALRVALVYDRVNKWGGAERVLLALHKMFPRAPLYTSVYNPETAPWAKVFDIRVSFLQNFPLASSLHEVYAPLMPLAFESFSFDGYDAVISLTSEAAKGIITKPQTLHLCYCLTPTRYLWSGYAEYFRNSAFRFLSKPIISYLRIWDKIAGQRPDCYLAISKEVQGRIKKYYSRESRVIYPPADLMDWALSSSVHLRNRRLNAELSEAKRYFLIVSRLVAYKRVDTVIRVFNKLGMSLKIVGQGAEEGRLKKMAGGNIEFLPYLTEEELSLYYKNAQALIFPGVEDFGLVMVEAQSHGTPVIALRAGGAREIILEGKTGEFFDREDQSLINVLENFDKRRYNSKDCLKSAERFSFERFKKEFMGFFEKTAKDYNFKPR